MRGVFGIDSGGSIRPKDYGDDVRTLLRFRELSLTAHALQVQAQ